jgi:hypothetical protein
MDFPAVGERDVAAARAVASVARFVTVDEHELTPKWSSKLDAFDVYIWDQCYAMEQSANRRLTIPA